MRMRLLSVLAATAVAAACQSGGTVTDAQRANITSQVSLAVDSLFAAMNDHDSDRVLSYYRKGNDFLYVAVANTIPGWDGFAQMTRAYDQAHADVTFEHRILDIQVLSPDVAAATIQGSASDAPYLMWTQVYVREGKRWLVALEHESWPGARAPAPAHPAMDPGAMGLDTVR